MSFPVGREVLPFVPFFAYHNLLLKNTGLVRTLWRIAPSFSRLASIGITSGQTSKDAVGDIVIRGIFVKGIYLIWRVVHNTSDERFVVVVYWLEQCRFSVHQRIGNKNTVSIRNILVRQCLSQCFLIYSKIFAFRLFMYIHHIDLHMQLTTTSWPVKDSGYSFAQNNSRTFSSALIFFLTASESADKSE